MLSDHRTLLLQHGTDVDFISQVKKRTHSKAGQDTILQYVFWLDWRGVLPETNPGPVKPEPHRVFPNYDWPRLAAEGSQNDIRYRHMITRLPHWLATVRHKNLFRPLLAQDFVHALGGRWNVVP